MSAVVEAVEEIGDGINKYIIEPIKNDPLTFLATVAGAAIAGPGAFGLTGLGYGSVGMSIGAGIGNAAAGIAQGEDFDEAIKGGAIAGLTTWAGIEGTNYLKSTFGGTTPTSSTIGGDAASLQKGISGTADSFGNSASQSINDALTSAAKESSEEFLSKAAAQGTGNPAGVWDQSIRNASTSLADDPLTNSLNALDDGFNPASNPNPAGLPDESLAMNNKPFDMYGNKNPDFSTPASSNAPVAQDAGGGVYKGQNVPGMGDASVNPASLKVPPGYDPLANAPIKDPGLNVSPLNKSQFGPQIEMLDDVVAKPTMWDKALGYGKDAYDWVGNNKLTTGATLLGLASLGGKDEPPSGGGNNEQIGDPGFYDPMRLYDYNRNQIGYGGDITGYGRTGGEHQFFTPTVYTPIEYATGGSVSPDNYGYYTYGNIPKTMRGFAQGGLTALAKGGNFDGRSDDIPAVLSDGEFVIDAETVALLGNGSSKAGANRLEEMRQAVRKQKGGALSRGQFSPDAKSPLAYLKSSKKSRG